MNWRHRKNVLNNMPQEIYWWGFPKWMLLYRFLKNGCFRGVGGRIKITRVLCLLNKHKWGMYIYSNKDYVPTPSIIRGYVQCERCGDASHKEILNYELEQTN